MLQGAGADADTINALDTGILDLRARARDGLPVHTQLATINTKVARLQTQRGKIEEEIGKLQDEIFKLRDKDRGVRDQFIDLEAQRNELEEQATDSPYDEEDDEAMTVDGGRIATHDAYLPPEPAPGPNSSNQPQPQLAAAAIEGTVQAMIDVRLGGMQYQIECIQQCLQNLAQTTAPTPPMPPPPLPHLAMTAPLTPPPAPRGLASPSSTEPQPQPLHAASIDGSKVAENKLGKTPPQAALRQAVDPQGEGQAAVGR